MERISKEVFRFSSGHELHANRGIFGLTPELTHLTDGYDGEIDWVPWSTEWGHLPEHTLTMAERCELADFTIDLWTRYARDGLKAEE